MQAKVLGDGGSSFRYRFQSDILRRMPTGAMNNRISDNPLVHTYALSYKQARASECNLLLFGNPSIRYPL